jgi:tRNA 5-methylaminomethyl-2-thiouridine biosynthesis bifunctional protein
MKTAPIVPAEVDFGDPLAPGAPRFGDVYHARSGAFAQAAHVFLAGNGLPARWQGREAFTILETGFGLGNNFLAAWAAWRADPQRCGRLRFVSVEKHPLRDEDLRRALAACPEPALAAQLADAWPPLTPDFHPLAFEDGRVELLLVFGDAAAGLRQLVASVDAVFLDGFAPARNPDMWDGALFKSLARLAAPGATAATWSAARAVRDGLAGAGFAWRRADGAGGKRDITVAEFAPRVAPRLPAARQRAPRPRRVAIVGGGLAGAACAQALAREGVACVVLDAHAEPAGGASGNAAGLFHGVVHAQDNPHARAHRAAALLARRAHALALAAGVPGRADGLLRLTPEHADAAPLAAQLAASGLPTDYVTAWSPAQVQAAGGPACAAWFYPGGGWIAPAALVRHWLSGPGIEWRGNARVARLECVDGPWRLRDAAGTLLAEADAVVLANAGDAPALWTQAVSPIDGAPLAEPPPTLGATRGQVSLVAAGIPGLHPPALPIAGAGYAVALPDGSVMCGATTARDDGDPALRLADHAHNLSQLEAITGSMPKTDDAADDPAERIVAALLAAGRLDGRVGWRCDSADRLPLVGAVPARWPGTPAAPRPDQPRHWPRVPGLYVCTAFGSRGLTWAPLAGRLLASWITDAPAPLPADLVDALDPARFAVRAVRASRRPDGAG